MLYPMTDRMKNLRDEYKKSPVARQCAPAATYGNHPATVYWLEGYYNAQNAPTALLRRSMAQQAEMDNSRVIISDNELIVGQPDLRMDAESREKFNVLYEKFKMSPPVSPDSRSDHTSLDYRKLLNVGVNGLISEIEECKKKLKFSCEEMAEDIEKEEFYDACIIELRALNRYAKRYEDALREKANEAQGGKRQELLKMADNLLQVPSGKAKTFWQALQSIHFYTFTMRGLYSVGRPDCDLYPYYKADIASGELTQEFAQELLDNYLLTFANFITPNTAAGLMLGGTDEDGTPVENELTWMFLNSSEHIHMPDPNIGLCISKSTSEALIKHALSMIGRGCAFPSFWNDDEIVRSLISEGFGKADSHRYINSTCVELTIIGKSAMWTTCPYHNLAQILLDVFLKESFESYTALEKAYFSRIDEEIRRENHKINRLKLERSRNASEPMLHSCLVDDCIKMGRNVGQGGAVYNAVLPNFLGFANAVDSLCAIRRLVYEDKKVSLEEYANAVKSNYEGFEALRLTIVNKTKHYGNNENEADEIAVRLTRSIKKSCEKLYTFDGDKLIPGIFSFFYHVLYGKKTDATPDGRKASMPLADSAGPAQGRDTNSPTAALLSGTSWKQGDFTGGTAQNIRLSKRYLENSGLEISLSLLKTYFSRGGCELQINCVDTEVLEDAIANPELHRDLLVRIGGYCDYFVNLDKKLQREIIERTSY